MTEQPGQGDGRTGPSAGQETAPDPGKGGGGPDPTAGRRALWLGGGGILLTPLFFPAGMVLAIAALVVGVRARKQARRASSTAPGAVPGIVLGVIGAVLASFWLVVTLIFYPEIRDQQQCLESANTNTDEKVCNDRFVRDVEDKLPFPEGSMSRYENLF